MEKIIRGVHEFQSNVFGNHQGLFERLAHGQQPETLFITCSDSRIDPSLLTQTQPGDLFIIRNAGNIIPPYGAIHSAEAATIEFAVSAVGVRDIIVCGHTHCGAMKGLLAPEQLESMPSVKAWITYAEATRCIIKEKYADVPNDQLLNDAVKENVLVQLDSLKTHPTVAAGVAAGRIKLHGWVYRLETGDVFAYDPQSQHFASIRHLNNERIAGEVAEVDLI